MEKEKITAYVINCIEYGDEPDLDELCELLDIDRKEHEQ